MSGIGGIWNLDGRPVDRVFLEALLDRLVHRGGDARDLLEEGAVGLVCCLSRISPESRREVQPWRAADGVRVLLDGRLDNRVELLESLDEAVLGPEVPAAGTGPCPSDPALVAAAYRRFGAGVAERLLGDFALAVYDPRRPRLLLVRDSVGVRPLYYAQVGRTVLFASEIKALLAHPAVEARPDEGRLAEFLLEHVQGPAATFFEGIRSVPPAHAVTFDPESVRLRRYWDFDPARRLRLGSFPEYAEEFRRLFRQAVRRRLRSEHPVAVSVSGGLDSSAILCAAEELRREGEAVPPVFGISYTAPGDAAADEAAYLRHIEDLYGTSIHRVPLRPGMMDGLDVAVWHLEVPWLEPRWNALADFFSGVRAGGARLVLTGHWADQLLFPQAYLVDLCRSLSWGRALRHLREHPRWFTECGTWAFRRRFLLDLLRYHMPGPVLEVFRRLRGRRARPWVGAALRRRAAGRTAVAMGDGRSGSVHFRSLYEEVRSAHHVMAMEWDDKAAALYGLQFAFPFLDRDLLEFLMAVPGEIIVRDGVPKAILREALGGVLPEAIASRRWKADFTGLAGWGVELDYARVAALVAPDGHAARRGYLDGDLLPAVLADLRKGLEGPDGAAVRDLTDLLGLELWLRVYFGEESRSGAGTPPAAGRAPTSVTPSSVAPPSVTPSSVALSSVASGGGR